MDYVEKSINALHKIVISEITDSNGIHAETAVSILAALVGVQLLVKTFENINDRKDFSKSVEIEGQKLFSFLIKAAMQCDIPVVESIEDIPPNYYPKENGAEIVDKIWVRCCKLLQNNEIQPSEQQNILILALLHMIKRTSGVLEPRIGMNIALHEIVKTSKSLFFIKKLDVLSHAQAKNK